LKREDSCRKHLGRIKGMFRDLNMILTLTATSFINLRKTLNLLLMIRSRKWKKNLKVRRSSKEIIAMILILFIENYITNSIVFWQKASKNHSRRCPCGGPGSVRVSLHTVPLSEEQS
jgi:hypothetical protein